MNSEKVAEFHRVMGFPVRQSLDLGHVIERDLRVPVCQRNGEP